MPSTPDREAELLVRYRVLEMVRAAEKLVHAVQNADSLHGGLLNRETIRASDELRVLLLRYRAKVSVA
jgi:hypothetical protein